MRRNAKALKRNDDELEGILIGPSSFRLGEISMWWVILLLPWRRSRFRAQILRHRWRADRRARSKGHNADS